MMTTAWTSGEKWPAWSIWGPDMGFRNQTRGSATEAARCSVAGAPKVLEGAKRTKTAIIVRFPAGHSGHVSAVNGPDHPLNGKAHFEDQDLPA